MHRLLPIGFDGKLVLVDDVVTRGSTLLGCAQRIEEAYPHAELAGFVAARTAKPDTVDQGLSTDPRSGAITFREGWLERDP